VLKVPEIEQKVGTFFWSEFSRYYDSKFDTRCFVVYRCSWVFCLLEKDLF
jgi:hypothetical protein